MDYCPNPILFLAGKVMCLVSGIERHERRPSGRVWLDKTGCEYRDDSAPEQKITQGRYVILFSLLHCHCTTNSCFLNLPSFSQILAPGCSLLTGHLCQGHNIVPVISVDVSSHPIKHGNFKNRFNYLSPILIFAKNSLVIPQRNFL